MPRREQAIIIQQTTVSLNSEQVDNLESERLLIVRCLIALQEDIMVRLIVPELRPCNQGWRRLVLQGKGALGESLGRPIWGGADDGLEVSATARNSGSTGIDTAN